MRRSRNFAMTTEARRVVVETLTNLSSEDVPAGLGGPLRRRSRPRTEEEWEALFCVALLSATKPRSFFRLRRRAS